MELLERSSAGEGEPGALHVGPDDHRIVGPDSRRRNAVELAMKQMFSGLTIRLFLVLMTLASSSLVIEAGQRWR
jgi:hypothetical protein